MKDNINITVKDAVFFLDMIQSPWSPNHKPGFFIQKPYFKLSKEMESIDYKCFLFVYKQLRNILSEREQFILNEIYGVDKERSKFKTVGRALNITQERVRQLCNYAERKLGSELLLKIKNKKTLDDYTEYGLKIVGNKISYLNINDE